MREFETETSVIWPAWCYTGKITANSKNFSKYIEIFLNKMADCKIFPSPSPTFPPNFLSPYPIYPLLPLHSKPQ